MASHRLTRIVVPALLLIAAGIGAYFIWRPAPESSIVGVVRMTEVRVAPEVGGQLTTIKVQKSDDYLRVA